MAFGFDLIDEGQLRAVVTNAMNNVANKVQKDLLAQARRNIEKYYSQYTPEVYDRTGTLRGSVKHYPILNNMSGGNSIDIEVGFSYGGSPSYSDGSRKYRGSPDPEWVMENFVEGWHPRTTVGYIYTPAQTDPQNKLMENYVDNYLEDKIYSYMQSELIAALSSLM